VDQTFEQKITGAYAGRETDQVLLRRSIEEPKNLSRAQISIHQALLDGVPGQLGIIFHLELVQDAHAIGADGLDAEMEFLSDVAHRLSGSNHAKDLVFAGASARWIRDP